ncbi:MAG: hypothetical protein ACRD2Y_04400 [Terriglobales bacterium]
MISPDQIEYKVLPVTGPEEQKPSLHSRVRRCVGHDHTYPERRPMMKHLPLFVLAATAMLATPVLAQEAANTNMEIFMQKVKADKKLLVANNMELSDAEAKGFWLVYDAYQKDLEQVNLRLGSLIKEYGDAYNKGPIPNDTAKKLLNDYLAVEEAELKLRRSYAEKMGKVLTATKVARYIQIESKVRAVVRFGLAAAIPLVY